MDIKIGADVAKDIRRMLSLPEFYQKVVSRSAEIHIQSARDKTWTLRSPSGELFQRLSPSYAMKKATLTDEPPVPNLLYGWDDKMSRRKPKAMNTLRYREKQANRGAEIYFDGSADSSERKSSRYMYNHQTGSGGVPQRKIFPEEQDMSSEHQAENTRTITNYLTEYLNQPRIIKGG